jgi:hypothetical protein
MYEHYSIVVAQSREPLKIDPKKERWLFLTHAGQMLQDKMAFIEAKGRKPALVTVSIREKRSLLASILTWPTHYVFLICFLLGGVVLCGGSLLLHIGDLWSPAGAPYSCDVNHAGPTCVSRQIGYLWAPNWSLTYAILGPLALCLMLEALKGIRDALDYLFHQEMVREDDMKAVGECLSTRAWVLGTRTRASFLAIFAGLIPAVLSYAEWYPNNLQRLLRGSCSNCDPSDYDWGLAGILSGGNGPGWLANSIFDFLSFTCEGLLIAAAVLCFLYLLDLAQVLPGPEGRVNKCLLPNLRSDDPRRGFQQFEEPLQLMLNACLTFFLICYSIRINRIYMRNTQGYTSVMDFLQKDIYSLITQKVLELKGSQLLGALFSTSPDARYQDFLGAIALILVAVFSLGVISFTVGKAARHAQDNAIAYYEHSRAESLFDLPVKEEKSRANKMTTWPLEWRYFQLDALLGIMGFALVSVWFYRLGLYVFLVVVATLLLRFKKAIGGSTKKKRVLPSKPRRNPAVRPDHHP